MDLLLFLPVLIFSVIFHEVAHGLVALAQGDDTAKLSGRLTLNPLPHLDLVGSILLPAFCIMAKMPVFGWAKPVPINPNRFERYRSGVIWVSMAGPLTNFLLAVVFTLALFFFIQQPMLHQEYSFVPKFLTQAILLNLVLAIFNLFPIPPLDGSRVLSVLLPGGLARGFDALEPYGFFILIPLISFGILNRILSPLVELVFKFLLTTVGLY